MPTRKGDNTVKSLNERNPKGSAKSTFLIIEQHLLSITKLHTTRRDKNDLFRMKFNHKDAQAPNAKPVLIKINHSLNQL